VRACQNKMSTSISRGGGGRDLYDEIGKIKPDRVISYGVICLKRGNNVGLAEVLKKDHHHAILHLVVFLANFNHKATHRRQTMNIL